MKNSDEQTRPQEDVQPPVYDIDGMDLAPSPQAVKSTWNEVVMPKWGLNKFLDYNLNEQITIYDALNGSITLSDVVRVMIDTTPLPGTETRPVKMGLNYISTLKKAKEALEDQMNAINEAIDLMEKVTLDEWAKSEVGLTGKIDFLGKKWKVHANIGWDPVAKDKNPYYEMGYNVDQVMSKIADAGYSAYYMNWSVDWKHRGAVMNRLEKMIDALPEEGSRLPKWCTKCRKILEQQLCACGNELDGSPLMDTWCAKCDMPTKPVDLPVCNCVPDDDGLLEVTKVPPLIRKRENLGIKANKQ